MNIQFMSAMKGLGTTPTTKILTTTHQGTTENLQRSPFTGSISGSSSETYDVRDLNKDGVVSALEAYLYELMHPDETASQNMPAQYDSKGEAGTSAAGMPRMINITV